MSNLGDILKGYKAGLADLEATKASTDEMRSRDEIGFAKAWRDVIKPTLEDITRELEAANVRASIRDMGTTTGYLTLHLPDPFGRERASSIMFRVADDLGAGILCELSYAGAEGFGADRNPYSASPATLTAAKVRLLTEDFIKEAFKRSLKR